MITQRLFIDVEIVGRRVKFSWWGRWMRRIFRWINPVGEKVIGWKGVRLLCRWFGFVGKILSSQRNIYNGRTRVNIFFDLPIGCVRER